MHKRSCFWKPFASERVNKCQKLLRSAEKYFYPTFSSRSKILGLLNTLTANYEYSCSNTENLLLTIQMQLSEKLKTSQTLIAFFGSTLN